MGSRGNWRPWDTPWLLGYWGLRILGELPADTDWRYDVDDGAVLEVPGDFTDDWGGMRRGDERSCLQPISPATEQLPRPFRPQGVVKDAPLVTWLDGSRLHDVVGTLSYGGESMVVRTSG